MYPNFTCCKRTTNWVISVNLGRVAQPSVRTASHLPGALESLLGWSPPPPASLAWAAPAASTRPGVHTTRGAFGGCRESPHVLRAGAETLRDPWRTARSHLRCARQPRPAPPQTGHFPEPGRLYDFLPRPDPCVLTPPPRSSEIPVCSVAPDPASQPAHPPPSMPPTYPTASLLPAAQSPTSPE